MGTPDKSSMTDVGGDDGLTGLTGAGLADEGLDSTGWFDGKGIFSSEIGGFVEGVGDRVSGTGGKSAGGAD